MAGINFPIESMTTSTAPAISVAAALTIASAEAGYKHVLTGIYGTVYGTATGTSIAFSVVGVVASGAPLYRDGVAWDNNESDRIVLPNIYIPAAAGDAVTASFATSHTGAKQVITLTYVTVPA